MNRRELLRYFSVGSVIAPIVGGSVVEEAKAKLIEEPKVEVWSGQNHPPPEQFAPSHCMIVPARCMQTIDYPDHSSFRDVRLILANNSDKDVRLVSRLQGLDPSHPPFRRIVERSPIMSGGAIETLECGHRLLSKDGRDTARRCAECIEFGVRPTQRISSASITI